MPMNSFLIRTSPSFGCGTGTSVLYCRTSVPPVFSMKTAFIVFGREDMVLVVQVLAPRCELKEYSLAEAIDEVNSLLVLAACEAKVINEERVCLMVP